MSDDDQVARLFKENDDLGAASSLWLRPLRQLFEHGKPIGQVRALTISLVEKQSLPFGMIMYTEKNRLVFWPILPSSADMTCSGTVDAVDHITLDFPSEKTHTTGYDADGKAVRKGRGHKLQPLPDCELALWFILLVRTSILSEQDLVVQRRLQTAISDKGRRTDAFTSYAQNLTFRNIALPPGNDEPNYVYLSFLLAPKPIAANELPDSVLVRDSMDSRIEGWPKGGLIPIAVTHLMIRERIICVVAACPPGKLRDSVFLGFPGKRDS